MAGHDGYGKRLLMQAAGNVAKLCGPSLEVDYGVGRPARIDGTVGGTIAIEFESRVSKQVRGAVLDLICHPFPKKLLALLPVHMSDPATTAVQCRNILRRFCPPDSFRVVVLKGSGEEPHDEHDAALLATAIAELKARGSLR